MPHLHVVVIRLPSRSATVASWSFVGRQRPPKTAGLRPQSVILRGRRPTAHSPPVVTTRQRISSCHSTARSRQHPRAGTANAAHISPDQSPATHPAGLRERAARKSALDRSLIYLDSSALIKLVFVLLASCLLRMRVAFTSGDEVAGVIEFSGDFQPSAEG